MLCPARPCAQLPLPVPPAPPPSCPAVVQPAHLRAGQGQRPGCARPGAPQRRRHCARAARGALPGGRPLVRRRGGHGGGHGAGELGAHGRTGAGELGKPVGGAGAGAAGVGTAPRQGACVDRACKPRLAAEGGRGTPASGSCAAHISTSSAFSWSGCHRNRPPLPRPALPLCARSWTRRGPTRCGARSRRRRPPPRRTAWS